MNLFRDYFCFLRNYFPERFKMFLNLLNFFSHSINLHQAIWNFPFFNLKLNTVNFNFRLFLKRFVQEIKNTILYIIIKFCCFQLYQQLYFQEDKSLKFTNGFGCEYYSNYDNTNERFLWDDDLGSQAKTE